MNKGQFAHPASPSDTHFLNQSLEEQLDCLSLLCKKNSQLDTVSAKSYFGQPAKSKNILKNKKKDSIYKSDKYAFAKTKRQKTIKKIENLNSRIDQLERQNKSLRRQCQNCLYCRSGYQNAQLSTIFPKTSCMMHEPEFYLPVQYRVRNSKDSVQFQAIDFSQTLNHKPQMDDRAWVMIGAIMMVIGSKNLDIDGTVNSFKVLNDCVDTVRRQVQKSAKKIHLDFYFMKEEMKESPLIIEGIEFDPFYGKTQRGGLNLESLKLESVEQFELIYDQKLKFSVSYDSLIQSFEHLKQNCWLSF